MYQQTSQPARNFRQDRGRAGVDKESPLTFALGLIDACIRSSIDDDIGMDLSYSAPNRLQVR